MNKAKAISNGIIIWLLYTIVYCLLLAFEVKEPYRYFSICVYIQFIYTLFSWHKCTKCWFDSYIVFSISLYVFTLGHSFLDLFGAVTERFDLIRSFGIKEFQYLNAEYISLVFILWFHFGAISGFRRIRKNDVVIDEVCGVKALKKVGLYGTILFLPFYLYSIIEKVQIIITYGYMGLYDEANMAFGGVGALIRLISDMYVPSIICMLVYSEVTKKNRAFWYLFSFITVCVPPFFIGARTNSVIMCGIIFLIYTLYNKISRKQVLITASIVYVFLFSLVLLRNARQMQDAVELADAVEQIQGTEDSNPVSSMISEMGWSMYPVVKTIEIKESPNEHFLYGSTILWGATSIFPNLFWDVHPAKANANMSEWITKKLNFTYGIGYSLVAESYVNFGVFGFVFMYFLSMLFMRLFKYSSVSNRTDVIPVVCSLIFLWFIIRIVRNNFLDTFRYLAFYVLPFYVILKYYSRKYRKIER